MPTTPQQGNTDLANPTTGNVLGINTDGSMPVEGGITPGDALAVAGTMPAVQEVQTGTGVVSILRVPTKIIPIKAQAVTAGTPVDVYTPTSGKKVRYLSWALSLSVAGEVLIEDGTGVEIMRTPAMAAGIGLTAPSLGEGILSSAANTHCFIDVSASGTVNGFIGIEEE